MQTPEERRQFFEDRTALLTDIDQVKDYNLKTDEDANRKAMMALSDSLTGYEKNLVGICSSLARIVLEQRTVRMGPSKDDEERAVTLSDIAILRAAVRAGLRVSGDDETPEVITLRRALSRLNPVQLFYYAIHGGLYRYTEKTSDRNELIVFVQRQRYFGGIPEDKLPRTVMETRRGELIERTARLDLRINPDNAQKIHEILKLLENEQPVVELPVRSGEKNVVSRAVARAGEADFFLTRLPRGLKEPRTPKAEISS